MELHALCILFTLTAETAFALFLHGKSELKTCNGVKSLLLTLPQSLSKNKHICECRCKQSSTLFLRFHSKPLFQ